MPSATLFDTEKIGQLLTSTARSWRNKLDQRLKPLGFTQGKWMALVHLANSAEPLTQRELAARMGVEEPTLAGVLNRLQKDGWIDRKAAAHDRRCKTVHLESKSKKVIDRIFNAAQSLRHELIADISPNDLQVCMRVLDGIRQKTERLKTSPALPRRTLRRNGAKARLTNA